MRPLPRASAAQFGAFTVGQALADGWTRSALRHGVEQGRLWVVRRGVLAAVHEPTGDRFADEIATLEVRAAAISLANPRVPASHAGCAALLDLPLLGTGHRLCASVPRGARHDVAGVHLHRTQLPSGDVRRLRSVLVLSPERTVVDLGRELGMEAALVAADAALHRGLTTPDRLAAAVAACRGWPGVRAAADAVAFADPFAESPFESLSRLRIAQAGLPRPALQRVIWSLDGRFLGRTDFYWDEFGVIGESDGMLKYDVRRNREATTALQREKRRQEGLEQTDLIAVRWGWDALADFAPTAARLERAFARGVRPGRQRRWIVTAPTLPPAVVAS
ncbi:MAG: hypothetical protein ACTHMS_02895 [Jatrophihabitans sp.]|uniref:hypothetical protein n=1 Tax=Jatrophihabitans sp. TaxID=1932789 RepID=UPI003F81FC2F